MGINGGENGMFVDYDHSIVSLSLFDTEALWGRIPP